MTDVSNGGVEREVVGTPISPKTYGVLVGSLWVAIDFEAKAVAITRTGTMAESVKTEELGDGVLIDRNAAEHICSVEVLG